MRRLKRRTRVRLMIAAFFLLFALTIVTIRIRLFPLVEDLARTHVIHETVSIINSAINQQITMGAVNYNQMVALEKNESGMITALQTNMSEVNRLKTQVLELVNRNIMGLSVDQIGIPVGNLVMPELFAGRGFFLPVKIISIRYSNADFENDFIQAGINQTLHQIVMNVSVDMTVLSPAGTQDIRSTSQVVVAETVIVGTVPNSYVTFDGMGQRQSVD